MRYSLSSDGTLMAIIHTGASPQLQILSTETLAKIRTVPLPPDFFRFVAFSSDNKSMFYPTMTGPDTTIWRRSLDDALPIKVASLPGKTVQWMRISPDGTRLELILESPQSAAVLLRDVR